MEIHGWGRYTVVNAKVLEPLKISDIKSLIISNQKIIARGLGRSYGDSANNDIVIDITRLNTLVHFDLQEGIIICEAGMSIQEINKLTIPKGWLIPVTPGSAYVTIGGAIASDIHGKNHHLDGTFSQYVLSADIILGSGEMITISKNTNESIIVAAAPQHVLKIVDNSMVGKKYPVTFDPSSVVSFQ
jgi:FAD/FMN-containing dehydrogenase